MARWISSSNRPALAASRRAREHGNFQVFPRFVAISRHAYRVGLERGQPVDVFDALVDVALVGGGGGTVFQQQFFGDALIDAGAGGQLHGGDQVGAVHVAYSGRITMNATTSKSLVPANSPFMA
jgi:hypothetical protein